MGTAVTISVPALVKTIKTLIVKHEHATDKAEQYAITLGLRLRELKERKPDGSVWASYVESKVGLGRRRADELIAIADGKTTVAATRAGRASRERQVRNNSRHHVAGNDSYRPPARIPAPEPEPGVEDDLFEDPENFRTAFFLRADQCNRSAVYTGPVTKDIVAAARKVAALWTQLANKLEESL